MKKQCLLSRLIIAIICLFAATVFSQEQYFVGCIDDMRGDVKIFKAAKNLWVPAQKLIPVEEKDTIKTGKLSFCRLLLDDGSCFRLDADSQLNLEELKIEKKNNKKIQTYNLKLDFGVLLSVFNKKSDQSAKFKIRTPVAVMSIRGTDFAVNVKGNDTKVGLFNGEMAVSSPDNENDEVALKPDQEANISKGSAPKKQDFLSSSMLKEKTRCQKLREYADQVRKKLEQHENYVQDKITQRDKHLQDWEQKRHDKLYGTGEQSTEPEAAPIPEINKKPDTEPVINKTEEKKDQEMPVPAENKQEANPVNPSATPAPVPAIKEPAPPAQDTTIKQTGTISGTSEQKPADNQGTK